jgi:sugar lactone lactonase YvrE
MNPSMTQVGRPHAVTHVARPRVVRKFLGLAVLLLAGALVACGGKADPPQPAASIGPVPPPPVVQAPLVTTSPANQTVQSGQTAAFSVVASGSAPLSYQWQRNGTVIAGATSAAYTTPATVPADNSAMFTVVVSNTAGSVTSGAATLTVIVPVTLAITQQPADTRVVAGAAASFTVAATCSSGTLGIQWQRSADAVTWTDIAGATATTYSLVTVIGDSGAQFRANLNCSGNSPAASNAATLTVTTPTQGQLTLSLLPIVGLRDQADISSSTAIDQDPGNSFTFITSNRVQRLSADLSTITPVAGGQFSGSADGAAANASFNQPQGLTQDAVGNIYVADTANQTIRRIAADGTVTTVAGLAGSSGTADGTGSVARFNQPTGIAIGPDGDLYVADNSNNLIRRVTTAGVVTTYAGSTGGYADGTAAAAKFSGPAAVAVAANGDVLVADSSNNRIRRIVRSGNVAGAVQTLAGDGTNLPSDADGVGTAAAIAYPRSMVLRGNTLTVRDNRGLLRQIDLTSAVVTTLTGSRALGEGFADGDKSTARIRDIGIGLTAAPSGGFMLADDLALRAVSAAGVVRTIASHAAAGVTPTGIGTLAQMPFSLPVNDPQAVTVDPAGNVVIADWATGTVRRISPAGVVTLAAGLTGGLGGPGGVGSPADGVGSDAQFTGLGYALAGDSAGVLYVADNSGLRRIGIDNATTQFAGSTTAFGAVDGSGATARFNRIFGLAAGSGGNVYAGDAANTTVRRIDSSGNVTTYAGVMGQSAQVDGPIATARFQAPHQVAFASDGALYVVDGVLGGVIRRIAPDGSSVSTLAGAFSVGSIAVDAAGTIYFGSPSGLQVMVPGGAATVLIPTGGAIVLGTSPRLLNVDGLAVLGPKKLVILSGAQILMATLP